MSLLGFDTALVAPAWEAAGVERHMEMLGEAGVRLLEIGLERPQGFDAARARSFARRWNVELFLALAPPPGFDPLERMQEGLDFLEPALRAAAEAGSLGLAGFLPAPAAGMAGRPPSQRGIDALSRFLERAARLAHQHGVHLALQPASRHATPFVNTAAQAAWLVERVGAESLRIALDTGVMNAEEESFARGFETAAPFLVHVRAAESNGGVPGRGVIDWPAVLKALAETGYSGPLTAAAARRDAGGLPAPWLSGAARLEEMVEEGLPALREAARRGGLMLG